MKTINTERDSANRRGQAELTDASNPSMMATSAESLSNVIIPHNKIYVKQKTERENFGG